MATRGEMVKALAEIFDTPVTAVDVLDRALSEAGLRTKSARGRAATRMTAEDIANDAIGLSAPWGVKGSSELVARLVGMPLRDGEFVQYSMDEYGEDTDSAIAQGQLSRNAILKGTPLAPYPRDLFPPMETFGGSLAQVLRTTSTSGPDTLRGIKVSMVPELPGAAIEFGTAKARFKIRFGEGAADDLHDQPPGGLEGATVVIMYHARIVRLSRILLIQSGGQGL